MLPSAGSDAAPPGVIIVGAGFAGLEVAKALCRTPTRVTVIDRHNHTLFQPLLYQVATAALSESDVAVPIRSLLHGPDMVMLLDEVVGVDLAKRSVQTASGRHIGFAHLVLASGSRYNYFGHQEWARVAPSPKTLSDAMAIRQRLLLAFEQAEMCSDDAEREALMTFVVVGAGPTGVEMAGAIAELAKATLVRDFRHIDPAAARILLIEAGPAVLGAFPEKLGRYAHRVLARLGVQVLLNTRIDGIDADGVDAGGQRIVARTVIWGAGVEATPVAAWLGVPASRHGSIAVNADFSLPGHPDVFVIGDAAEVCGGDGKPLPGLAAVAKQEGQYVGDLLRRRLAGDAPPPVFRYRDYGTMATIGRSAAVADLRGLRLTGALAWMLWGVVHLYFLIGFRNRLLVLTNWLWAWLTYGRGARLIIGDAGSRRPPVTASVNRAVPAVEAAMPASRNPSGERIDEPAIRHPIVRANAPRTADQPLPGRTKGSRYRG